MNVTKNKELGKGKCESEALLQNINISHFPHLFLYIIYFFFLNPITYFYFLL
jgi:hypothetical protein